MVFGSYAQYYDLIYQEKDYLSEIEFLENLAGFRAGISILDLGCGTGGHDIPLAKRGFQVIGVDVSEGMISQAKQKASEDSTAVTFLQDDIRSVRLRKTFDIVISMFAVMSYQIGNDDFLAALRTARIHLGVEGLFIFDAWFGPAVLAKRPETRVKEIPAREGRIIRVAAPELSALQDTVTVNYTVLRLAKDRVLEEVHEAHPMRFFFAPEVAFFAKQAGFEVQKICPFLIADRIPDERDWNVTWVLRAV